MTRTTALAAAATAGLLTLTLAACSDNSDSSGEGTSTGGSGEPSSSSSSAMPAKDRSEQVFDSYTSPEVLGSASGEVVLARTSSRNPDQVTFEVTGVTVTTDATTLRYQITSDDGDALFGMEGQHWFDQPTLHVPDSNVQMQPVTAALPEGTRDPAEVICVCTSVRHAGENPRSQTTMYPPLPADTTEVEVTLPGLDSVTVPVTK